MPPSLPHLATLLLLTATPGRAAEPPPDPQVEAKDGWVWATVHIPVARDLIFAALADPRNVIRWEGSKTQVTIVPDGACARVDLDVPSAIGLIRYAERRCPTADGYRATLIESEDFEVFEDAWVLVPDEGGTLVRYGLRSKTSFLVPQSLANRLTGKSLRKMLRGMREELARR
jgi:hypothetical protein